VVLAIVALALIAAAIVYIVVPAGSLPVWLGHTPGSTGHRPLRAVGCLISGVVFAVGAWFTLRYQSPVKDADAPSEKTPANL
jgi:multisubunit Na+/H+ antiporter MnhB subunit